jgi:hypothetical protein
MVSKWRYLRFETEKVPHFSSSLAAEAPISKVQARFSHVSELSTSYHLSSPW